MQVHAKESSNFVLDCHLDLIGNQDDVQYVSIYCVYVGYLVLYLPTVLAIGNNRQKAKGKRQDARGKRQGQYK